MCDFKGIIFRLLTSQCSFQIVSCNAGFSGAVVATAIAPFFNSTCQGILLLESIYAYILHLGPVIMAHLIYVFS